MILYIESFWAACDPQMALAPNWPQYTSFYGNPIKVQAVFAFFFGHLFDTINSITLEHWDPHVLIKYLPFFWDFADCCGIIESGETTLFYANSFYSSSSFIIIRILTAIIIITIPIIDRLSRSPSGQMLWWFVSSVNLSGKQLKCSRAVEGKLWKCFRLLLFWFRFKTEKARQR